MVLALQGFPIIVFGAASARSSLEAVGMLSTKDLNMLVKRLEVLQAPKVPWL